MLSYRVLVIGGYGFFGRRLVERLSFRPELHITVAGRSAARGRALVDSLKQSALAEVGSTALDVSAPDGLAVVSGASSVPALSSAVADHLAQGLARVHGIDIGISPGHRTERGLSTVQAILSYCGKPLPARPGASSFGWSGRRRHGYPAPVGSRLLSPCDVPDLVLLPERYQGRPSVSFGAGLELTFLHWGMNVMASMTRMGLVSDWSRYAWYLLATGGDGPHVPTLAAAALVRKLQSGDASFVGARPCLGVLTLADFVREMDGLRIKMTESSA